MRDSRLPVGALGMQPVRLLGSLLLLLAAGGCSSTETTLYIESKADTNSGRPFYVVLRTADDAEFITDTYDGVTKRVFARPADETVIRRDVVYPGIDRKITFDKPERQPIAIYFLFTEPGERWKSSLPQPIPDDVQITLGQDEILQQRD